MNRNTTQRRAFTPKPLGFTLIELLVVIAIIAILAAILFPVFAQARDKARAASCLSNVKQMTLAFNMYAQDYDENLPFWAPQCHGNGAGAAPCVNVGGDASLVSANYHGSLWAYALQPYIKNYNIFACPSDSEKLTVEGRVGTTTGVGWLNYASARMVARPDSEKAIDKAVLSYGISPVLGRYLNKISFASIDRPTDAFLIGDATNAQIGVAGLGGVGKIPSSTAPGWLEAEAAGAPANDPRRLLLLSQAVFARPNPRICVANAGVALTGTTTDAFANGPISSTAPNIQRALENCTRHQQGSNVGFLDGHAKYIKGGQLTGRYFGIDSW
jgi:prepilin-type N-terminal cleavage/methylation domain-containing protein/prepilin-type processing-associated H-X9-DG protein